MAESNLTLFAAPMAEPGPCLASALYAWQSPTLTIHHNPNPHP